MSDLFKKAMYMGVGLAELTREKLEEFSREMIEKGELSEKEGRSLVDEMLRKSEETRKSLEKKVDATVEKALARINIATRDDLKELEKKLNRKIAALKAKK